MLQIENARNGLENFIRDYENKGLSNGDFDREHKENNRKTTFQCRGIY